MNEEIQLFLRKVEKVLNGRTLFLVFDKLEAGLEDRALIKKFIKSKAFDEKILEADWAQQEGDLFYRLTAQGYIPIVNSFTKKDIVISSLEQETAFRYLVTMLTANTKNTFWSPYHQEIAEPEAAHIVASFLDSLGDKTAFRFYQLNIDFMDLAGEFWHHLGSDSVTVIVTEDKLLFLFTNGGD